MTNARTCNRLIRLAAAGLAGAAAIVLPLAGTAGAAFEPIDPAVVTPLQVTPGTVSVVDGTLHITTATNSASDVVVFPAGVQNKLLVRDKTAPLQPGAGCFTFPDWGIICNEAYTFEISTGNFNDRVLLDANYGVSYIHAGLGNDTVTGGKGSDWIWGESGKDVIHGGSGADVLLGGDDIDYDHITGGLDKDACYQANFYAECENVTNNKDIPR